MFMSNSFVSCPWSEVGIENYFVKLTNFNKEMKDIFPDAPFFLCLLQKVIISFEFLDILWIKSLPLKFLVTSVNRGMWWSMERWIIIDITVTGHGHSLLLYNQLEYEVVVLGGKLEECRFFCICKVTTELV